MRALVTGAAGFLGSHLAERLVEDGHKVRGVDAFRPTYARPVKEANLHGLCTMPSFCLVQADLAVMELAPLLDGVDVVYHLAGQPGVRTSWGAEFAHYLRDNVMATQRLLEAARTHPVKKLVFASSSSVYGRSARYPTGEDAPCNPISPYGVSKLAAERLCLVYCQEQQVPAVVLRYFTVYGPRQRPDMAVARFIAALMEGRPVTVFGDGSQTRDLTYVSDAVEATIRAGTCGQPGDVMNIAGGNSTTVRVVLERLQDILGCTLRIDWQPTQAGDATHTHADLSRAQERLGYQPRIGLGEGLRRQVAWALASAPRLDAGVSTY